MDSDVQAMSMEDHVIKQEESDLSIRKYCQANGINEHTFRYWKTKQEKKKMKGKFTLVDAGQSSVANPNPIMSIIHPNKVELHIPGHIAFTYLLITFTFKCWSISNAGN